MSTLHPEQKVDLSPSIAEAYGDVESITYIFYWFIALLSAGMVAGIFIVLSTNDTRAAILIALTLMPVLASIYFVRHKKFEITAAFLAIVLMTMITIVATQGLGVHHISVLGFPAILIVASLVVRKRVMGFLTAFNVLCVAWLVFGELSDFYIPSKLERSVAGDFFSVSMILILTAVLVRFITEALFKSNLNLRNELTEHKKATDELK